MSSHPQQLPSGSAFRQPGFRTIWLAQLVSVFGDFLALFGVMSLITFRLHRGPVEVTAVIVAYTLPLAVLAPIFGVAVDHLNVKRTMITADVIRGVLAFLLLICGSLPQIAGVLLTLSVFSSLFLPAQAVAVRAVVPKEELIRANAALAQAFYVIRIVSPLVAGALVAWLGEQVTFVLDSITFFVSAGMLATLAVHVPRREDADKTLSGLFRDFREGNRFIFTHPGLSFVFVAMAVAVFVLGSFSPLVSIFIRDQLHSGTFAFGVISAFTGVGLIVCSTVMMRARAAEAKPYVVLYGLLALGIAVGVLGLSRSAWLAGVSTFGMGIAVALVLIPSQTMSQQETAPEMVGRVSSTFTSIISLAQVLGLLLSGGLAQRLGIRHFFFAVATLLVVFALAGWLWLHKRYERQSKSFA